MPITPQHLSRLYRLLLAACLLLSGTACSLLPRVSVPAVTPEPTVQPQPTATHTATTSADPTSTPTSAPPTPTLAPQAAALWIWAGDGLWRYQPGQNAAERVHSLPAGVASLDRFPGDGRLAYGMDDGRLFIMLPGGEPALVFDAGASSPYTALLDSLAWSPDGTRLAFTVRFEDGAFSEAGYPSPPSGLWLWEVGAPQPEWLLSNRYLNPTDENVSALVMYRNPKWSPDGQDLMITELHWEWMEFAWMDLAQAALNEDSLARIKGASWSSAYWSRDGRSILGSGAHYSTTGDLVQVDPDTQIIQVLISGEETGMLIEDAQEIGPGIAFIGTEAGSAGTSYERRLYLAREDRGTFTFTPLGPAQVCRANELRRARWDTSGAWGVLVCGENELHLIEVGTGQLTELAPFLSALPRDIPYEVFFE